MSYRETITFLYNLRKEGIKFRLDNTITLMSALNNPHTSFLSVHVAGTNGKGSTAAIIASVLKATGLKVGLFTSPHLISFTERIKVNDNEISEDEVMSLTEEIRGTISTIRSRFQDFSPTFFEVVTAIALLYFRRKRVDAAVMEVGMGGRLDATNVIIPEVSVITSVGNDHRQFLGDTLREIAHEKAGVIKNGVPVVISPQDPGVLEVIETEARERNTEVYLYGRDFSSILKRDDLSGIYFDYCSDSSRIRNIHIPLTGEHQMYNASVAIKAVELIDQRRLRQVITADSIRDSLRNLRWPGRLEIIRDESPVLIDGAHNPDASVVLAKALVKNFLRRYKKIIFILGIMSDKDIEGIMKPLLPLASEIILTSPNSERAAPPEKLASVAASLGFSNVLTTPTVRDAMDVAEGLSLLAPHDSLIVVTGSFYSIGEAKEVMGHKGVLMGLRE